MSASDQRTKNEEESKMESFLHVSWFENKLHHLRRDIVGSVQSDRGIPSSREIYLIFYCPTVPS